MKRLPRRTRLLLVILVGSLFILLAKPTPEMHRSRTYSVAELVRALNKKDSYLDKLRSALSRNLPQRVNQIVPGLKPRPAAETRRLACQRLADLGPKAAAATSALAMVLDDPALQVRFEALNALQSIGRPAAKAACPALIAILRKPLTSSDEPLRQRAEELLVVLAPEDPEVVSFLLKGMERPGMYWEGPSKAICEVIAHSPDGATTFDRALKLARWPQERSAFVRALAQREPDQVAKVSLLTRLLTYDDNDVRKESTRLLGEMGPLAASATKDLINTYYKSSTNAIQLQPMFTKNLGVAMLSSNSVVVHQTGSVGGRPSAYSPMPSSLQEEVMATLGRIGPAAKDSLPFLIEQSRDLTNRSRPYAAAALAQVGADPATFIPILTEGLKDSDAYIRRLTIFKVNEVIKICKIAGDVLTNAFDDADMNVRLFAASTRLRAAGDFKEVLPIFEAGLSDSNETVRYSALLEAAAFANSYPQTLPLLMNALNDPVLRHRRIAIETFALMGTNAASAVPTLQVLASGSKGIIQIQATNAVKAIQAALQESSRK